MAGGFGGGSWGGSWGAFLDNSVSAAETVSVTDSLTITFPLRVTGAEAPDPFLVSVTFNHVLIFDLPSLSPDSYSIPGLTVTTVSPGPTPNSVYLATTEQGPLSYTVTVLDSLGISPDPIDPLNNSAVFAGFPVEPAFFATAQSAISVQLTFSTAMLQNIAYTDPASYSVMDLNGANVPILSVTAVGPGPNRRVVLGLGASLASGGYYVATVLTPLVQTVFFLQLTTNTDLFQWIQAPKIAGVTTFVINIGDFTGEVTGGILGEPLGLLFFSPSLNAPAPNSIIQVDEASVCARAFDVYTPPSPPDPPPLYTFSGNGPAGLLGTAVLFARFERLLGAKLNLNLSYSEVFDPSDGPAVAILAQPFDPAYVSLLNNSFWALFGGAGTPFKCADNLAPIPPGPTTVILLQGLPESELTEGFSGDPWGGEIWG
jgi:hypothetical protein